MSSTPRLYTLGSNHFSYLQFAYLVPALLASLLAARQVPPPPPLISAQHPFPPLAIISKEDACLFHVAAAWCTLTARRSTFFDTLIAVGIVRCPPACPPFLSTSPMLF